MTPLVFGPSIKPHRWEWMSDQAWDLWERALPQHQGELYLRVQWWLHSQPHPGWVPWWVQMTGCFCNPPLGHLKPDLLFEMIETVKNVHILEMTQWPWLSTGFSTTLPLTSSFANCITESLAWNFFLSSLFKPLMLRISFQVFLCPSLENDYSPIFLGADRVIILLRPRPFCPLTEFLVFLLFPRCHPFSLTAASSFPFLLLLTQGKVLTSFLGFISDQILNTLLRS